MSNIFYVYMYLRSNNSKHGDIGSPYYIGKGQGNRVLNQRKHTRRPVNTENIVYFATDLSEPDAHQLEMLLINRFGRIDIGTGCLRNRTDGGEGLRGHKPSSESIAKRVAKMLGRPRPEAVRLKISLAQKGRSKTPEQIAKSALGNMGKVRSKEHRKAIGDFHRGKKRPPFSEEWKAKISAACKGHKLPPRSDAHRALLSQKTSDFHKKRRLLISNSEPA